MKNVIFTLVFLFIAGFAFTQEPTPQEECESGRGYWKETPGTCLARNDMDSVQVVLFKALRKVEQEKAQALHTQQDFNQASVDARKAAFDARIASLETKRDAASGVVVNVYQEQIDKLTARRDYLDSQDPGSPRDEASKLGPVIAQLSQDIGELKAELDSSIP